MSFKTRTIRLSEPPEQPSLMKVVPASKKKGVSLKKSSKQGIFSYFIVGILLVFGMFVVIKISLAAYHFVSEFKPADILDVVGSDLKKDKHGYTNILLLGDGGYVREGAGLVDSIMVASIDYKKNAVSLLSIPRDYYVTKSLNLGLDRYGKINQVYNNYKDLDEEERFEKYKMAVGNLVDLDLQYYMRIDFHGFVEVVDSLGGITVDVPQTIDDPEYPNSTDTGFDPFYIEAGLQELDGETALKYARSRHDFSGPNRDERQQMILEAIRQKALSAGVLTDYDTLSDLYDAVNDNFTTDLSLREMATLGSFAQNLDRSHIISKQLKEGPLVEGGLLYVPNRAVCGAWCLLPFGEDLDRIHQYADLVFNHREIYYEPAKIQILNASQFTGVAGILATELKQFGFQVEDVGNYENEAGERQNFPESIIEYTDWTQDHKGRIQPLHQSTLTALSSFVKAKAIASTESAPLPPQNEEGSQDSSELIYEGRAYDIKIILGDDYAKSAN